MIAGVLALGVQRAGGDHFAGQRQGVEQRLNGEATRMTAATITSTATEFAASSVTSFSRTATMRRTGWTTPSKAQWRVSKPSQFPLIGLGLTAGGRIVRSAGLMAPTEPQR